MKKIVLTLAVCAVASVGYAQGYLVLGNTAATLITTNGSSKGEGTGITRGGFLYEVYVGPASAWSNNTETALTVLRWNGTNVYSRSSASPSGAYGRIVTTTAQAVTGYNPNDLIALQVRGWSASLGATWEAASANTGGNGYIGQSAIGIYKLGGSIPAPLAAIGNDTLTAVGNPANPLFVLNGFELKPVPEPSTIALVGLGLAGLYFIRRRK